MLISGGARGMGAVEAKMFTAEGASAVFGDILDDEGKQVEPEIREADGEAAYVHLDVTQEEDWQRAKGVSMSKYGSLNILINNAGIVPRYSASDKVEGTTEGSWNQVMDVNVKGVFLGTKCAILLMRGVGGRSIVNISSGAGIAPSPETPASYSASKGAVRTFAKSTAIEYAKENIRCNSVHPGPILTSMLQGAGADGDEHLERTPLGRAGRRPERLPTGPSSWPQMKPHS